jgi:hypothetical protein
LESPLQPPLFFAQNISVVTAEYDNRRTTANNAEIFSTHLLSISVCLEELAPGRSMPGIVTMNQLVTMQRPALLFSNQTVYVAMGGCGPDVATELWNSNQNAARDALNGNFHFEQFTVVNGHVYIPDGQNNVVVYGLLM